MSGKLCQRVFFISGDAALRSRERFPGGFDDTPGGSSQNRQKKKRVIGRDGEHRDRDAGHRALKRSWL
jgi:hypothetical protein